MNNLIYKIDKIEGVDIGTLCSALKAFDDEFQRYTNKNEKLVVKEIRKGSGIFEFTTSVIVPTLSNVSNIIQFATYLKKVIIAITNKSNKLEDGTPVTNQTITNASKIFAPVIYGNNNVINIYNGSEHTKPEVTIDKNIYKDLGNYKQNNDKPTKTDSYNKVLFKWTQTNFNNNKKGNKGVVEKISKDEINVIFADDNSSIKNEMTTSSTKGCNWQGITYVVDIEVMKQDNKMKAYKILQHYPNDTNNINEPNLFPG